MDNLKKFKFEELDHSEMIQVQGGGIVEDAIAAAEGIVNSKGLIQTLDDLLKSLGLSSS